jgi:hypothetical protein
MRIEISRRELAVALSGLSAAAWIGMPALAVETAPVPMPPACRSGRIAPYLVDEAHGLYRLACAEWRAYSRLEETGQGGSAWSRLYLMKVEATAALRERVGHWTSDERALRVWLAAIYQTNLSAVAWSDGLPEVSLRLKGAAVAFQKHLLLLPFPEAPGDSIDFIPRDATALEAAMNAAREAAWTVLGIDPCTTGDAAQHRRAAMFVADRNVARFLEARWAGIEAARKRDVSLPALSV